MLPAQSFVSISPRPGAMRRSASPWWNQFCGKWRKSLGSSSQWRSGVSGMGGLKPPKLSVTLCGEWGGGLPLLRRVPNEPASGQYPF